jgi:mono/diheme cytochrome c family protein
MKAKLCASWLVVASLGWSAAASSSGSGSEGGEQTYATFCASCHGRYGRGDGPLAKSLTVTPPDFSDSKWLAGRSDEQILEGLMGAPHARMAVASVLQTDVLKSAIAHVRTLSVPGEHVSVPAGRDVYNAACWVCHGEKGDGKGPAAGNVGEPRPRDFTSPQFVIEGREDEIARIISQGAKAAMHGSSYMVEWGSRLSPQQIQDVVAYLKTFKQR